jgi:hypothetical protein
MAMLTSKSKCDGYGWMLELSAEGWAWEFLRRNADYKRDFATFAGADQKSSAAAALRWGLLKFSDPEIDARTAIVFWSPAHNHSVLPLVTAGKGNSGLGNVKCKISMLQTADDPQRHVLFSCGGRFLQLAISGSGEFGNVRYLVDAFPEHNSTRKLTALRRLGDLIHYKRLRAELYSRQRRGPRLLHLIEILDSYVKDPSHRSIARCLFGEERVDKEWENLRDHVRRAIAAGRKMTQSGYLGLLV